MFLSSYELSTDSLDKRGVENPRLRNSSGVWSIDLWLDTSTRGIKLFYTSPEPILGWTYLIQDVYINIIYNFSDKDFSAKQTVFIK